MTITSKVYYFEIFVRGRATASAINKFAIRLTTPEDFLYLSWGVAKENQNIFGKYV